MEESAALLTVIPARTPNRSHAAKPPRLTAKVLTVPAAMEAMAPGIPAEDMVPAILLAHTPLDRILPVRVHPVGVLRTLRVAADRPPGQAPPAPVPALARRVQAAQAAARAAGLSEWWHFSIEVAGRGCRKSCRALFRKKSFRRSLRLDCGLLIHRPTSRISPILLSSRPAR